MRGILFSFLLTIVCVKGIAQNNYACDLIAKDLLPYASVVVRNEEVNIEIKDLDNVIYHIKKVVTVLNKNGDTKAGLSIYYDKITSVKTIKGFVYDEFGKSIQKIAEKDFDDYAVSDGFSLFNDDRVKVYKKAINQYPYTIEFEYELKAKQSLHFPSWQPNDETGLAVEKSAYSFTCPVGYNLRYKEFNIPSKMAMSASKDGRLKIYKWQVEHIKALKNEPFTPIKNTAEIKLMLAPEKFVYETFSGSFTNWQQFGKWMYDDLIKDREAVPTETANYIKQITDGITDPKLKAQKIYEYMQHKTHYISVQVGIGGYRPFLASDVDKDGYGDCKALVNYTKSLFNVVGIESYYCVVHAGRGEKIGMVDDFASIQGNHIILCLPFKNDTTWLECTNQKMPFGFLGDFTDDRTVLACTPEGGKLLHTPKYTADNNLEKRKANFVISATGELTGDMETVFKGTDYEDREGLIAEAQADRIKEVHRYYPINNLEIEKLDYKQDKSIKPTTTEYIKLSAHEYAAVTDGKLYFAINSVNRTNALRQMQNRINPVYINRGYTEEDEITYTLPKGYRLDSEPLNKTINKNFGSFTVIMTLNGDKLTYKRKFQLKDGTYSKETYDEMVDFYQTVNDADLYNVALVKN